MKLNANEFIDKAESLKATELNVRQRLERIKSERETIQSEIETLRFRLESLDTELDSLRMFSDGETDNSAAIASIMVSISLTRETIYECQQRDSELQIDEAESSSELRRIELQEQETLKDIQESATSTNQNLLLMSSIEGDYGNVAAQASSSFQQNLDRLSHAAQILGGIIALSIPNAGGGPNTNHSVKANKQSQTSSSRNLYEVADTQRKANKPVRGSFGARRSASQQNERDNRDLSISQADEEYGIKPKKGGLGRRIVSAVRNSFSNNSNHSDQAPMKALFCERYTDLNQLSDDVYQSANDYVENHTDYNSLMFKHQTTPKIEHLREIINQHGIPENEVLFRRATLADLGRNLSNLPIEQLAGKCYLFDGIMSTGSKTMADTVSHGDVIFEIKATKGISGLDLTQVASFQEAMFASPLCYIESAEKTANGETYIVIKLLSTGENTKEFNILNDNEANYRPTVESSDTRIFHDRQQRVDIPSEVVNASNLTNTQKNELIQNGFSEGMLDRTTYKDGIYRINTSNSRYAEGKHPDTNIPYKTKTIEVLGNRYEGVFPVFDSKFDASLPESKIIAKDKVQFEECNKQLKDDIQRNPKLRKQFSKRQIEQIEQGKTPSGYVWNHNEIRGKMELVDFKTHELTSHTGGKAIWGGGSKARKLLCQTNGISK